METIADSVTIVDPSSAEFQHAMTAVDSYLAAQSQGADPIGLMPESKRVDGDVDRKSTGTTQEPLRLDQYSNEQKGQAKGSADSATAPSKIDPRVYLYAKRAPHDPNSARYGTYSRPPQSYRNNPADGYVGIDCRSGPNALGVDGNVNAYSGFGFVFQANRTFGLAYGMSIERCHWVYNISAYGVSCWASAEGGIETRLLQIAPGAVQVIGTERRQLWRGRVSTDERSRDTRDNVADGVFSQQTVQVVAGRSYVVVGNLYSISDYSIGVGRAGSQSLGEGYITALWLNQ